MIRTDDLPPADKRLAQHWLFDAASLEAVVAAAHLEPTDTVLEIGPGPGPLTAQLVAVAADVRAVELDRELAESLADRLGRPKNLQVIHQDFLSFDLRDLPAGYRVVSNIPYNISGKIVRKLIDSINPPDSLTLLMQKEVAQRIAAAPGRLSILAVVCQLWGNVTLGPIVKAAKFTPPPKVDSQIITIFRTELEYDESFRRLMIRIVKFGFANRRKILENSLSAGLSVDKAKVGTALAAVNITPGLRAQDLTIGQWAQLASQLVETGLLK